MRSFTAQLDADPVITLTHEFFPTVGGIATYVKEMAGALQALGQPVEVWAPDDPKLIAKANTLPFRVRPLPVQGTQSWSCRLRLAAHLHSNRRDWRSRVLYLPEPGPLRAWMYLQALPSHRQGKLVLTLHGSEIERFSRPFYRRWLFNRLLSRATRIGVVSQFGRKRLLKNFDVDPEKVVLARGALRTDMSIPDNLLPECSCINRKCVILTVGRIHPRKGQLTVVNALGQLPQTSRQQVIYRIVGPCRREKYLDKIRQAAEQADLELDITGAIDDDQLPAFYRTADIFAMTSHPLPDSVEGFGLTYLEASAYGLPVIAHRTGGVGDAVKQNVTGLKVDPGDLHGLTNAFRKLISDESLRKKLGTNGLEWVRRFSWKDSARILFEGIVSAHLRDDAIDKTHGLGLDNRTSRADHLSP